MAESNTSSATRASDAASHGLRRQISTTMAQAGLNIHNMVNKSRGEMAYTLVDVDSPVQPKVIESLSAIEGVLSVRAIPAETAD